MSVGMAHFNGSRADFSGVEFERGTKNY